MKTGTSLGVLSIAMLTIVLLAAAPTAAKQAADETAGRWMLRISPTWLESDRGNGNVVGVGGGTLSGYGPEDLGLSVAGEYRYSPRVGLDLGILATASAEGVWSQDGAVVAGGTWSYGSFTLGPNIHLLPEHRADLFVGPFLAYNVRTSVGYESNQWAGVRVDGGIGWGAVLGAALPVGEGGWRVCMDLRYFDIDFDGIDGNGDPFRVEFGPTTVAVGAGYRF